MMVAPKRRKVVVVEDDADLLELETLVLAEDGFEVIGVADGRQAVSAIREGGADLVLLDFMLPGKDANEILEELQADPLMRQIPVFVISAFMERLRPTPQVRRTFAKPLSFDDVLQAVRNEVEPPPAQAH